MTETIKATKNKSALSSEVPTNQQQQLVEKNNETKLIIENKEFAIIPYQVNKDTEWYIPELGLMIKKSQKGNPIEGYDKEDSWEGFSSSVGTDFKKHPYQNLIGLAEEEVNHWKKKIKELPAIYLNIRSDKKISDQLADYQTRLQKAINGWEYLKKCQARAETKSVEISHPGAKGIDQKRIRKKCLGCCDTFTCSQSENYDYCCGCEINGSRYVARESKCSECGDGSGLVKFPNQPPRNCKLCYLANQEQRREKFFAKYA